MFFYKVVQTVGSRRRLIQCGELAEDLPEAGRTQAGYLLSARFNFSKRLEYCTNKKAGLS